MRRTVFSRSPSERRVMRLLLAALLALAAAALGVLATSLTQAPPADAQTTSTMPDEPTFGVRCDFSHRNTDDPIVYPGKQGAAHGHDFFGNRTTKYNSTYTSLRNATTSTDPDGTTCTRPDDKSAYWIPTVKWNGTNLKANRGIFYYRANGKTPSTVKSHPAGLKVVPNTSFEWRCTDSVTWSSTPPTQCSNGFLEVRIMFPDCSNGQLDSADHRSHMAYAGLTQGDSTRKCPSTHPTPLPTLSAIIRFPVPTTAGTVTLSSGAPSTLHADFFNAWKQEELDRLVKKCINDFTTPEARPRPADCEVTR